MLAGRVGEEEQTHEHARGQSGCVRVEAYNFHMSFIGFFVIRDLSLDFGMLCVFVIFKAFSACSVIECVCVGC